MRRFAAGFLVILCLPACAGQPATTAGLPAPVPSAPDSSAILAARRDSLARAAEAEAARRSEAAREAEAARLRADRAARDTLALQVHFAFDRAELPPEGRALLERKAAILRANPTLVVDLAGHCDERGSDEYNLVLGQRRAQAIRQFLVGRGVSPAQLLTSSYGEEAPLATEATEWAWARNRRGEFTVLATPGLLRLD